MVIAVTEVQPVVAPTRPTLAAAVLSGKALEAQLTLALADGLFRFSTPEGEIDLPLPRPLPPGTQVRIAPQPDGTFQVTVLNEGLPAPAVPKLPAPIPALLTTVQPSGPAPALTPGQEIIARVTANPEPGIVRVATPQGDLDLPLPRPVPPGTPLRITADSSGAVRVSVPEIPVSADGSAKPTQVVHPSVFTVKPETAPGNIPQGQVVEAKITGTPQPGVSRFVSPEGEFDLPLPRAFPPGTQARVVAQPNGNFVVTVRPPETAPLPNLLAAQTAPSMTGNTIAASMRAVTLPPGPLVPVLPVGQIIEGRISTQPASAVGMVRMVTAIGDIELPLPQHQNLPPGTPLRIAPQPNGGLSFVPMSEGPETGATARPAIAPQPSTPAEAVRQATLSAVTRQDGLANLFADIEDLPMRVDAPNSVRRAAETLLDRRLTLDQIVEPDQIAKAIAGSGLFAERMLASLPSTQAAPPDMKLALFILRAALGTWSPTEGASSMPLPRGDAVPPPPTHGTPPAAQSPSEPTQFRGAAQQAPPDDLVPHLVRETDAALARVNLHQIASLPDDRGSAARGDTPDTRWSCEVPVNVDGRTAMFGFVIERDGRHAQQEKEKRRWRFRAAIDLPDTGAVEADVRLMGDHVSAGIVAEEPETVALLEAALPILRDGLTAQGFEVEMLSVRQGKGTPPAGPPGYFMDRRS